MGESARGILLRVDLMRSLALACVRLVEHADATGGPGAAGRPEELP